MAFLQGERKGQENLKQDLVRRIKMLEFALKQERSVNYHSPAPGIRVNNVIIITGMDNLFVHQLLRLYLRVCPGLCPGYTGISARRRYQRG